MPRYNYAFQPGGRPKDLPYKHLTFECWLEYENRVRHALGARLMTEEEGRRAWGG